MSINKSFKDIATSLITITNTFNIGARVYSTSVEYRDSLLDGVFKTPYELEKSKKGSYFDIANFIKYRYNKLLKENDIDESLFSKLLYIRMVDSTGVQVYEHMTVMAFDPTDKKWMIIEGQLPGSIGVFSVAGSDVDMYRTLAKDFISRVGCYNVEFYIVTSKIPYGMLSKKIGNYVITHEQLTWCYDTKDISQHSASDINPSTEAMSISTMSAKRKQIMNLLIKVLNTIDPSGENAKRYTSLLEPMSDTAFDTFMKYMRSGKYKLHLTTPNMKINLKTENILKAAKLVDVNFFHRLWMYDEVTGKKYLTNEKYPVFKLPVRRQQQFLQKKLSVADDDRMIDQLSGQVVNDDKSSSISSPEIRILQTRGLDNLLVEFVKVRGGDIHAYSEFKRQLEENGNADLTTVTGGSRARSATIVGVLLNSMMIDVDI